MGEGTNLKLTNMEQCGDVVRSVEEDRISALPEPLILQILSSLPTKLVIATSVLSKQWRCVWKMVPVLRFESKFGDDIHTFAENVSKSLLSHKAPVLDTLHLKLDHRCKDVYFGIRAGIATTRSHVRGLELYVILHRGRPIRFPCSLFCYDTLRTLKLKYYILLDIPSLVPLNSLRTLHLHFVVYKDSGSIRNLLSSCPNLEHLVVRRRCNDLVKFVIESLPSLKTLSLYGENFGREDGGYVINAPSLRYLNIQMLKGYDYFLIENAPELIEANMRNVSRITNETVMGSLKSAKRLCLDLSPLQIAYPTGIVFHQLVYLEMYSHKVEWWNLLTVMLDSSPKLQVLKLIDHSSHQPKLVSDKKNMEPGKWNQPEYVPLCLLFHLETFVWTRHDWAREEEKEVAIYILGNARHLKKATFIIEPIESKKFFRLAKRREMLNELPAVVRASSSCQLVFESE